SHRCGGAPDPSFRRGERLGGGRPCAAAVIRRAAAQLQYRHHPHRTRCAPARCDLRVSAVASVGCRLSVSDLTQPKCLPMLDLTARREDLEPVELASRAEISELQLERLKRTLRRPTSACRTIASHLRPQACTPTTSPRWPTSPNFPSLGRRRRPTS